VQLAVAVAEERRPLDQRADVLGHDGALLRHDLVEELRRRRVPQVGLVLDRWRRRRRHLQELAGDDRPDADVPGSLGDPARADLVLHGAVVVDRVGTDEDERGRVERAVDLVVRHELDLEPLAAQVLCKRPPLLERRRDRAEHARRRRVHDRLPHRGRCRVREDERVPQRRPEVDGDRRRSPLAGRDQTIRLLGNQLPEIVEL
jgi:hypothetical protein